MNTNVLPDILNSGDDNAIAISIPEKFEINYSKLKYLVHETSEHLKSFGTINEKPIVIVLGNNAEFIISFLSVTNTNAVVAPLNPEFTEEEFKFYLEDINPSLVITTENHKVISQAKSKNIPTAIVNYNGEALKIDFNGSPIKNKDDNYANENNSCLFLHTSGTTSRPKGVPLKHKNLLKSLTNIVDTYELNNEDIAMVVMPLFHVHGLIGVALSTLASGGQIVIPAKFSASAFWDIQKKYSATWYSAVPTIHQILLLRADQDKAPKKSFRIIRSCSAALAPSVLNDLEERFGAPVLEAYGMTEAAHQMSSNPLPPEQRKPGSVGKPTGLDINIMSMEKLGEMLDIDQVGEIVIKGENVTSGYHNNNDANKESYINGWFRTGDQGFIDKDGYLSLTGRIKELINRGGEKISPLEVDSILINHPSVNEAVCFAFADTKYGEVVHAALVVNSEVTEKDIQEFCSKSLASFKVPEKIYFTDKLPRTATGKIQRRNVAKFFN
jgi:acyl-CoA synthetase (AMP-forming)/AMP-acid ligase II|tara:strand:- start:812 stop:2305 length:1494 start_codon:yes stop_codon:yes gene_type:complete